MARDLPLGFGLLMAGGLLISHGAKAVAGAFGSGSSAAPAAASAPAASGTPEPGQIGQVRLSDLQSRASQYGWDAGQIAAWQNVIRAESGGDPTARNPSSGAFGIGQFLGSTLLEYARFGATSTDPGRQLDAMARYIHDRYGSPAAAWAHEQSHHWY